MSIRKAVTALLNHSSITSLAAGGVEPVAMPQDPTFPIVVYRVDDSKRLYTMDGCAANISLITVEIFGENYLLCEQIIDAIEARCVGYVGTLGGEKILRCSLSKIEDLFLEPQNAESQSPILYRIPVDLEFLHVPA